VGHQRGVLMRRLLILSLLAALLAVSSAAPVGAAPAEKTEYMTMGCNFSPPGWADRFWWTGTNGNLHFRGSSSIVDIYLLVDDDWELIGTQTSIDNANVDASLNGTVWGTSSYRDDGTIGDFDGRYRYPANGRQTGTAKDADGRLMKIVHGVETPIPLLDPWRCAGVKILVIDPHA